MKGGEYIAAMRTESQSNGVYTPRPTREGLGGGSSTSSFIRAHRTDDVRELMLQASRYPEVDMRQACVQISAWQTARTKLPLWAETEGILFPEHLSMEQCSSQATAEYKGRTHLLAFNGLYTPFGSPVNRGTETLYGREYIPAMRIESQSNRVTTPRSTREGLGESPEGKGMGPLFTDLTGGFGVDATMLALAHPQVYLTFVERNPELCDLARHNLPLLGVKDVDVVCGEAEEVLPSLPHQHLIYLDPARRDSHGGKTVAIEDCTPNLMALQDLLLEKADCVMVKLSPMLDIRLALRQLRDVTDVHVVSLQGECKEILLVMRPQRQSVLSSENPTESTADDLRIHCVNLPSSSFSFTYHEEQTALCSYTAQVQRYLYEPNASVMKAAPFKTLAQRFGLQKLHPASHLYTSDTSCPDFPGRQFEVVGQTAFNKKELRRFLAGLTQANLTVRNFPLSVADLRRRLRLGEGGTDYLFATTLADNNHVLIRCQKTTNMF